MVDVYSNAICTLAASGSINSHGGLFHARNPLTYLNCQIGQSSFFSSSSVRTFVSAKNAPSISEERNSTSFGKRAWTIQEQLLSTRLIYFGKRGIFWRCDTCVLDENDPTGRGIQRFQGASSDFLTAPDSMEWADRTTLDTVLSVPPPYPTDRGFDERFHTPWNNLVREYFRRSLTLPQDRPMALAGIAAKIQLATLRRYRAGLWEDSIYYDLMWWVKSPSLGKKQLGPGQYAPSWSWASAEGEELSSLSQSWAFVQHWGFEVYMPTQEQEISTHPESQGVKEGLEVHGVIRGLPSECIMPNPDPSSPDPYILTVTVAEEKLGVIYPDTQSMDRDDLVLLLCFQDKMEHVTPMRYSEYIICGLVLKPVDGNEGTNNYYRVGAFKFSSDSKISSAMEWFARYPAQRITMF